MEILLKYEISTTDNMPSMSSIELAFPIVASYSALTSKKSSAFSEMVPNYMPVFLWSGNIKGGVRETHKLILRPRRMSG